jgi:large subunit ribosomal protein L29
MEAKDIRELSTVEIEQRLRDTRAELLKSRLHRQTGQLEKTHTIRVMRKDIARLETALHAKSRASATPAAAS